MSTDRSAAAREGGDRMGGGRARRRRTSARLAGGASAGGPAPASEPEGRRNRRRRHVRRRRVGAVLLLLLVPVVYSYVSTMMRPSSLPLSVRSVEWVRANHGAWLVNDAERLYYTWNAPSKGGPTLRALPPVGSTTVTAPAPAPAAHAARRGYRPRPIVPILHPRLAGEGVWQSMGRSVSGAPTVLVTTFRSEREYPRIVAYVAWFDHTRTRLALYPGRYEPPNASPRGPMQVPYGQRWRLLASFNSGFTYRDSHGGFSVNGVTATPLRDGQGTVVAYRNGRVNVVGWKGGAQPGRNVVLARQNLPLIVDRGRPNPLLSDSSAWGNTLGNAVRVWRSGVGVDRHGNLLYVAASDQTAPTLAAILIHAGAVRAMELDINAEWPSLITYGRNGVGLPDKIVPNSQQSPRRYLSPDDRDFFAVYRRLGRASSGSGSK
jgi:hypothetical protein